MPRYIDVSNLPNFEVSCSGGKKCVLLPFEHLSDIPTADVVEAKHGEWIFVQGDVGYSEVKCSRCDKITVFGDEDEIYPYCPFCGAKMDGERKEE